MKDNIELQPEFNAKQEYAAVGVNAERMRRFQQLYHNLSANNISRLMLAEVYHPDIHFTDPFHDIQGLEQLAGYFLNLYENVNAIDFDFSTYWAVENHFFALWQMIYQHPKINSGKPVVVDGGSELIWQDDKIIYHQDLFDAGQMLYEKLPILAWLIKKLMQRMS